MQVDHELGGPARLVVAIGERCEDARFFARTFGPLTERLERPSVGGSHAVHVTAYESAGCRELASGCVMVTGAATARVRLEASSGPCARCDCATGEVDAGPEDAGPADAPIEDAPAEDAPVEDAGTDALEDACTPRTYGEVVLADTPSAFYRFEEGRPMGTAIDEVGTHHAMYGDRDHEHIPSVTDGNAVRMSTEGGRNPRILLPESLRSIVSGTTVSVEVWMRRIGFDATFDQNTIFVASEFMQQGYRFIHREDGRVAFLTRSVGGSTAVESASGVVDDGWHHFVLVIDGTEVEGYVDGERLFFEPAADIVHQLDRPLEFGIGTVNGVRARADYDELALYDRALDADTIAAHHAAGLAGGDCR